MTSVLLIYPFFIPRRDRSVFRFPPLGISYLAASLRKAGHEVSLIDCTFMEKENAVAKAMAVNAEVVGIYCMATLLEDCLWFARRLREQTPLLVAGGPLPTCNPKSFLQEFDVVVRGEGEQTMVELLEVFQKGTDLAKVKGIVYRDPNSTEVRMNANRPFVETLNQIPFPARDLLPNDAYMRYSKKKYGYSISTVLTTRGCPYRCEFCSNVVFGGSYRARSPVNVVDEIEETLRLGYDRISFADDVFTMEKARVGLICEEIQRRGLHFYWECLGRVDSIDAPTAAKMKAAGCSRIYFGIESANEEILKLMNKKITSQQARNAVEIAHTAGIEVGAFFILFYPGDTNETVLQTIHYATSLPLDYLGLSMPYPLPGTALFERVKERINRDWHPDESLFGSHVLIFNADFSEAKMWFGIIKGQATFRIKKKMGRFAPIFLLPFEKITDLILKWIR